MKMKMVSVLTAVAVAATLLAGCGASAETAPAAPAAAEESTAEEPAEEAAEEEVVAEVEEAAEEVVSEVGADTQAIIDRGVLKVGVKNAVVGFGFQDTLTGEYSGLEISIAEKIAGKLGVDIEFTTVTAATRTELLDSGDIDCVLATFTITDERKESWDFTTPYFTDHVSVLVQTDSGITSLADLKDKSVGVSSGSTSAKSLTAAMLEAGVIESADFNPETFDAATWTEGIAYKQYDDYPAISIALSAGEVDAFCVDKSILAIYNTDDRNYINDEFAPQDYGIATKKGSDFSAYAEACVEEWLADGTIAGFITENNLD